MNQSRQLAFVLIMATVIAAVGSHTLTAWVRIKTTVSEPLVFGQPNGNPPAFRAGSSLADYQINWSEIATQTDTEIKAWGVAAGSPYEFEQFQKLVPEARTTYIVISAFDMDEANVSDFRASIVPLSRAIESLRAIHSSWKDSESVFSEYPMSWLRTLFPTLGRSRDIMGLLHERVLSLIKPSSSSSENEGGPRLDIGNEKVVDSYRLQRVSDWSRSEITGKLAAVRASLEGKVRFDGLKRLAFLRMLHYGCQRGRTIVIVVPVSGSYSKQFMTPELTRKFEASLADARRSAPASEWVRLDQVPDLDSDQYFCDIVHMNVFGQKIVTDTFLAWLQQPDHHP